MILGPNVSHLEFKMADIETVKCIQFIISFALSETIKARDLIFGTGTPWDLENKMFQSEHQVAPPSQVAPPTCQNLTLTISQRLSKIETQYLAQVLLRELEYKFCQFGQQVVPSTYDNIVLTISQRLLKLEK